MPPSLPPRRFKAEHVGRTSAETELAQLREQRLGMEQQVRVRGAGGAAAWHGAAGESARGGRALVQRLSMEQQVGGGEGGRTGWLKVSDCKTECELSEAHSCTPSSSPHSLTPSSPCQIAALDAERGRLHDQVSESRSNAGRLEASLAADVAVISEVRERYNVLSLRRRAEHPPTGRTSRALSIPPHPTPRSATQLRGRLSSAESRLEGEQSTRLEMSGRLMSAEMQLRGAQERVSELTLTVAGEGGGARGAQERVSELTLTAAS